MKTEVHHHQVMITSYICTWKAPRLCNIYARLESLFQQYVLPTYLSSSGPVAHKAEVNLLHLVLSAATCLASFQLFHPSIRLSFSIVDRHVVFGRPTFLLPSGVQVSAVSQLLFFSIRRICPTHFHLLILTTVLIVFNFVFARISRFDTTYGHRICRIRLKHLKKNVSNFLLSPSLIFHVSLPYNNTGLTSVLKSLNFDLNVYIF